MRVWMLKALNSFYVRVLLRVSKWTILILFAVFLFIGMGVKFVFPKAIDFAKSQSNTQVEGSGENAQVLYKDQALPRDFQAELDADPEMLIYENQARSKIEADEPDANGGFEDGPAFNRNNINPRDSQALLVLANNFLSRWETFGPTTDKATYSRSLAPYVGFDALEDVTARKDNIQNSNIAPGAAVGSKWVTDGFTPERSLLIQRYDGETAYLTTLGEIVTTGSSLVFKDTRYIRSYSLIVNRGSDGSWKVERAVAQTRSQVIE